MTAPHTHCCSAFACIKQIPLNLLMCMGHWRMVPAPVQREVLDTWRTRQRRPNDVASQAQHEAAKVAAIAAVYKKQVRKIADKEPPYLSLF